MNAAPNMISTALQMLTALGLVLGGLVVLFYILKRFIRRDGGGPNRQLIKVIANQYIGVKKNIALVEIPGSILVLGVSSDHISLLTKIEDRVVMDGIRQGTSGNEPSFSDHLQRLTARFRQAKNPNDH